MVLRWICLLVLSLSLFAHPDGHAQPSLTTKGPVFQKEQIQLGTKKIVVEIARTNEQHEHGLMFRQSLPADGGMLFIFPEEQTRFFWMKNTFIDLSIGYFDKSQTLIDVQEMKASTSVMAERPITYPSRGPAQYALEMNKAWFEKNNIKPGIKFKFLDSKLPK